MTDLETIRRAQTIEVFAVRADAETGEWLDDPQPTGEVTNALDWAKMRDTEAVHFDTYLYDADTQTERAIRAEWVA